MCLLDEPIFYGRIHLTRVHSTTKALGSQYLFGGVTLETTSVSMTDTNGVTLNIDKALSDSSVGTWSNSGKIWANSYQGQDYYSEEYSVGLQTTFTN